jgi:hypothetical protein
MKMRGTMQYLAKDLTVLRDKFIKFFKQLGDCINQIAEYPGLRT